MLQILPEPCQPCRKLQLHWSPAQPLSWPSLDIWKVITIIHNDSIINAHMTHSQMLGKVESGLWHTMLFHAKKLLKTLKFWKSLNSLCKSGSRPQKSPKKAQKRITQSRFTQIFELVWCILGATSWILMSRLFRICMAKGSRGCLRPSYGWPKLTLVSRFVATQLRCQFLKTPCQFYIHGNWLLVMSICLRWAGSFPWTCKSK